MVEKGYILDITEFDAVQIVHLNRLLLFCMEFSGPYENVYVCGFSNLFNDFPFQYLAHHCVLGPDQFLCYSSFDWFRKGPKNIILSPDCLRKGPEDIILSPDWLRNGPEDIILSPDWLDRSRPSVRVAGSSFSPDQFLYLNIAQV